jgi:hypothetical protein
VSELVALVLELTFGVTGILVLRALGGHQEDRSANLCLLVGLVFWAAVAGIVVLVVWLAGGFG